MLQDVAQISRHFLRRQSVQQTQMKIQEKIEFRIRNFSRLNSGFSGTFPEFVYTGLSTQNGGRMNAIYNNYSEHYNIAVFNCSKCLVMFKRYRN